MLWCGAHNAYLAGLVSHFGTWILHACLERLMPSPASTTLYGCWFVPQNDSVLGFVICLTGPSYQAFLMHMANDFACWPTHVQPITSQLRDIRATFRHHAHYYGLNFRQWFGFRPTAQWAMMEHSKSRLHRDSWCFERLQHTPMTSSGTNVASWFGMSNVTTECFDNVMTTHWTLTKNGANTWTIHDLIRNVSSSVLIETNTHTNTIVMFYQAVVQLFQ